MKNLNETVNSSFRFLRLNKLQAYTLEREISGGSQTKDVTHDCYIGSVILNSDNLEDIVNFFIRQRIETCDCDIFISVTSNMLTNTIDASELVNRMIKFIDCKLSFSYTVVQDAL